MVRPTERWNTHMEFLRAPLGRTSATQARGRRARKKAAVSQWRAWAVRV